MALLLAYGNVRLHLVLLILHLRFLLTAASLLFQVGARVSVIMSFVIVLEKSDFCLSDKVISQREP